MLHILLNKIVPKWNVHAFFHNFFDSDEMAIGSLNPLSMFLKLPIYWFHIKFHKIFIISSLNFAITSFRWKRLNFDQLTPTPMLHTKFLYDISCMKSPFFCKIWTIFCLKKMILNLMRANTQNKYFSNSYRPF